MAVVNGLSGSVVFSAGSGLTSNVKEWSITLSGQELDTTAMGTANNWDTYIGGRKSWSGTWTGVWDSTGSTLASATAGLADAPAEAVFRFFDDTTDGTVTGNILVTEVGMTVNVDGVNEYSYSFRGTAAPTVVVSA